MIILGQKYKFQPFELEILHRRFDALRIVPYRDRTFDEIRTEIESDRGTKLIVLNTRYEVPNELIAYLTKLELRGYTYTTIEHFMERHLHKCYIPEDHTDLRFLEDVRPYSAWQMIQKRTIDYLFSIGLLLVSSPILLYSISRIHRESPGRLLFRQMRVGKNGEDFKCIKFRSMHENSHHDPYTRKNDTRIYPWGSFMRRTRIDEIPQIFNVLRGDMHLIGPRAEWNILVDEYETQIPYYHERHLVAPGITGWAQVNYPYGANIEDTRQKLMYDLYYIKYWSLALELRVIWKTVMVVMGKKGL
ncbi:MAG: sugar transferase [Sulfurovum sp. PC08-66]|nr:MAG: sugar transferase [Sulfurovum sp. PC08-66]KIM12437.1 MAG: sugar transferase [Sulfuricurvum sp. PC08-66]